ncbi:MAG TPA: hypothetical protein VHP33_14040 [Polyangiaceae bacterium]|nr:hypothetical protein [Polyangiaceae bacterium]
MAAVCLVASLHASPSHAQESPRPSVGAVAERQSRVSLRYEANAPPRLVALLVTRLRAELRVAGFVAVLPTDPEVTDAGSPQQVADGSGYAEIALSASGERVQLEITSQSRGASSHVVLNGTEREIGPLALQATEFLRAGVTPREASDSTAEARQSSAVDTAASRNRPESAQGGGWVLDLGATLLTNWSSADRLPLLSVGTGYALPARLLLGGSVDVPLASATFRATAGSADYRMGLAQLHADYAWLRWASGEATLGLAIGMARVTTAGRPQASMKAINAELWSLTLGAQLAAELRFGSGVALLGRARLLGLSPNPLVAIGAEERRLGGPALLFELGVRVGAR